MARLHIKKTTRLLEQCPWTDQTKVSMFGHNGQCYVWQKINTACLHKHLIPTVSMLVKGL